jgi:hypothetical protein
MSVCDGAWVSARQGPARHSRASSQTDPAHRAMARRERHTLIYIVFPSSPIQRLRSNDLELGVQPTKPGPALLGSVTDRPGPPCEGGERETHTHLHSLPIFSNPTVTIKWLGAWRSGRPGPARHSRAPSDRLGPPCKGGEKESLFPSLRLLSCPICKLSSIRSLYLHNIDKVDHHFNVESSQLMTSHNLSYAPSVTIS